VGSNPEVGLLPQRRHSPALMVWDHFPSRALEPPRRTKRMLFWNYGVL